MKYLRKVAKDESGVILMASTMGIFIILSIFAFYLARFSSIESRTGGYHALDIKARNLAMTGIEHGIQSYKFYRSTSEISENFNNGTYTVSYDSQSDEIGLPLSKTQYLTLESTAKIDDVERNMRLLLSSLPEAFCFALYAENAAGQVYSEPSSNIVGDMFFNGTVQTGSATSNGVTYIGGGTGGAILNPYPEFPDLNTSQYESLLASAASAPSGYNNFALSFDGSNDYVKINNSSDINTGSHHTQKTIETWFKVNDKSITNRKQTIYEQGGTVRGLNIYIHGGKLYVGGWNEPGGESNWQGTWLSTSNIQSGIWHHVALTLNGGNSKTNNAFKGYLDGQEFGYGQGSKLWNHPGDISIGRNKDTKFHSGDYNSYRYFGGYIDEMRLWNITRTQTQISTFKDTILDGNETGLTAYYNFQENSGNRTNDTQTQSNNDGTRHGATWTSGPVLSKMSNSSFVNKTVNLNSYTDKKLLAKSDLFISNTTFNGPGYIVSDGDITINSNSVINGGIFIVCSGNLYISNSQIGKDYDGPAIAYVKGVANYNNVTTYGIIIAKGNGLTLNNTSLYGAILNYSQALILAGNSNVVGSVVSKYSVDMQGNSASITRGNIPEFSGYSIGLDPFIIPGSLLEF